MNLHLNFKNKLIMVKVSLLVLHAGCSHSSSSPRSAVVVLCTLFPSAEIITPPNPSGEGSTELLFGLFSFPAKQPLYH